MLLLREPIAFEWDRGNQNKNLAKHHVTDEECEEVFFDQGKQILRDVLHSGLEDRFILLGETKRERLLFIVFTVRLEKIRMISARDVNKKERILYEEKT